MFRLQLSVDRLYKFDRGLSFIKIAFVLVAIAGRVVSVKSRDIFSKPTTVSKFLPTKQNPQEYLFRKSYSKPWQC
jgi:hypothetical protein